MSGNPIHHMFNPLATEDEIITETFRLLEGVRGTRQLPPNLITHPQLMQHFISNTSVPAFN